MVQKSTSSIAVSSSPKRIPVFEPALLHYLSYSIIYVNEQVFIFGCAHLIAWMMLAFAGNSASSLSCSFIFSISSQHRSACLFEGVKDSRPELALDVSTITTDVLLDFDLDSKKVLGFVITIDNT